MGDNDNQSLYHYPSPNGLYQGGPTKWVAYTFLILFSVSTALHLGQAVWTRRWFMICTIFICGIGEILGWSARLWSAYDPMNDTPFTMQISTTIIAPTGLAAAEFLTLERIIKLVGPQYSRLTPRMYAAIFLTTDLIALIIQGAGGGIASAASTDSGAADGGHLMLGGIIFQLVTIFLFSTVSGNFLFNAWTNKSVRQYFVVSRDEIDPEERGFREKAGPLFTKHIVMQISALIFITTLLIIRSIYRTIELINGWGGTIITTERYFNWLDGGAVLVAMFTLNIFHPSWLLYKTD